MQNQSEQFIFEGKIRTLPHLLNGVNQPVMVVDMSGKLIYINHIAEEILGLEVNDDQPADINEFLPNTSIYEFVKNNNYRFKNGEVINSVFTINNRKGEHEQIALNVSLIQLENETYLSLVGEPSDIAEIKQLKTANQILTEVDTILGDEVNYEAMLKKVVEFVIPQLADICAIHSVEPSGSIDLMTIAPADLTNKPAIHKWMDDDLANDDTDGLPAVSQSGKPILITEVNPVRRAAKAGIKSYMILPLITHRKIRGAISFISTDGSRRFFQDSLELAENLAIIISIYMEKNRLHKETSMLKAELEQRVIERTSELSDAITQLKQSEQVIQTLFRISKKLNATLDVDLILDELAQEAIQIVNGESGFAGLRTEKGMQMKKYFYNGTAFPYEYTWAMGEGIPGWVLKYKVPYGTIDAGNDPLIRRELKINDDIRSVICTPILDSTGEVIGFFDIRNKLGAEGFSISDQEMLLTLAPVASIAIQNAVTYQRRLENVAELKESSRQLEELAAKLESTREEERLRISRELHDQLGQSLTAIKFDLTSLANQLVGIDEDLAHKSKDIMTQLNTMIKTVRRISTELRPGMLDDLGLVASIEWQAGDFQKRTGIECRITAPAGELKLTKEQSLALFRVFQEALTNVARYANAKQIDIVMTTDGDRLLFEIQDNGRGIRPEEMAGGQSLGLLGMRERIKRIGGEFSIEGKPDKGTTVRVSIPLLIS